MNNSVGRGKNQATERVGAVVVVVGVEFAVALLDGPRCPQGGDAMNDQ